MNQKKGYTVLFAEDEEIIRKAYLNFLSYYFENVIVAEDGKEAFELYKKYNPDLVITDIVMPKIDGLTLIKMIRQNDDITRTILLTAYSEQEQLLKATELNITKYLIKPVRKQAFKEALDRAISQLEKINDSILSLIGNFSFHKKDQLLMYNGEPIPLSRNEQLFIYILTSEPTCFFPIAKISEQFYLRYNKDLSNDAIKSLIKRLKKKLPDKLIENRFGMGYRILK
ncbi:response regulator [Hydrogenimonas thermophila]|uniref:response regulator n=1 Tax=Hydrogenimonas thermophila TaxID=223786 RepID=UPI002936DDE8|nr:response regulator [Hydrogenimonas thermophila]WOE70646.1 response regulator [Hydrogenimonas thermophila]WOE73164.1 response regulator [Hydrogenimonas thermophila]